MHGAVQVSVFSGATVLNTVFGWPRQLAAVGLVALTAAYTALGGLAAVIVTDVAQSVVLLLGAASMTVAGLRSVGGLSGLMAAPPPGFVLNGSVALHLNCSLLEAQQASGATMAAAHCLSRGEWRTFFRLYRPACAPLKPAYAPLKPVYAPLKSACAPLKSACAPLKPACAPLKNRPTPLAPAPGLHVHGPAPLPSCSDRPL